MKSTLFRRIILVSVCLFVLQTVISKTYASVAAVPLPSSQLLHLMTDPDTIILNIKDTSNIIEINQKVIISNDAAYNYYSYAKITNSVLDPGTSNLNNTMNTIEDDNTITTIEDDGMIVIQEFMNGTDDWELPETSAQSSTTNNARKEGPIKSAKVSFYPNPFNDRIIIDYSLVKEDLVSIILYTVDGKKVYESVGSEIKPAGNYSEEINGSELLPGTYICRFKVSGNIKSKVLIKIQ